MKTPARQRRILMVCAGRPDRPRAGNDVRVRQMACELAAAGHAVELVAFVARNHPAGRSTLEAGVRLELRHTLWLDLAAVADRLGLTPITALPVWLTPLRGWIRRRTQATQYDAVLFVYPWFAALEDAVQGGARVLYDAHNIESQWWRARLTGRRWWIGGDWPGRLQRWETAAIDRADAVACCTEDDQAWIVAHGRHPAARAALIPNGYDARRWRRPAAAERIALRERFGFAAHETVALLVASHTAPNVEAARHVLTLAEACPAVRFVIAGSVHEGLGGIAGRSNVQWLGRVDDVLPLMQAADLGLNPMTSGGGSNLKLAEYLAAGLAVVTTPFGLRGYADLAPWARVGPVEAFAELIGQSQWPNAAPPEAVAHYSWAASAARLNRLLDTLDEESPPVSRS